MPSILYKIFENVSVVATASLYLSARAEPCQPIFAFLLTPTALSGIIPADSLISETDGASGFCRYTFSYCASLSTIVYPPLPSPANEIA